MSRKFFALILAFMVAFSVMAFASAPSDWARDEVGTKYPGMFESMQVSLDYQRPITRAEFSMLAFDVYSHLNGSIPQIEAKNPFTDLGSDMVNSFVALAHALGIVKGVSETEFAPTSGLTRQELCTMLFRIFTQLLPEEEIAAELSGAAGSIDAFADHDDVADWAKDAMDFAISREIIKGVGEGMLAPTAPVTVEQAMVICSRITSK